MVAQVGKKESGVDTQYLASKDTPRSYDEVAADLEAIPLVSEELALSFY
jgi:hypothetical protein